jgi:hypothetical protein
MAIPSIYGTDEVLNPPCEVLNPPCLPPPSYSESCSQAVLHIVPQAFTSPTSSLEDREVAPRQPLGSRALAFLKKHHEKILLAMLVASPLVGLPMAALGLCFGVLPIAIIGFVVMYWLPAVSVLIYNNTKHLR